MGDALAYVPVSTPLANILCRRDSSGKNLYEMSWIGRTSPANWDEIGGQLFVDVISPHGRRALIGIAGLVLAESGTPIDWVAFLLPLVRAEYYPEKPEFADSDQILANRQFIAHACSPNQTLSVEYQGGSLCVELSPPFLVSEPERKLEILELLEFLSRKDPFFVHAELSAGIQDALFGTAHWIGSRLGHTEWFMETLQQTVAQLGAQSREVEIKKFIRPRVDADRLIERTSQEQLYLDRTPAYDVFLSHFHGDNECADAIEGALATMWPTIRVFRTRAAEAEQRRSEISVRFLEAARQSRCIVFIATPNSLGRQFVRHELGNNALRPICTLLVDVRREDFELQRRRELHVAYDPLRIFDVQLVREWQAFFDELARILGKHDGAHHPPRPALCPGPPSPRSKQEEGDSYLAWAERTRT